MTPTWTIKSIEAICTAAGFSAEHRAQVLDAARKGGSAVRLVKIDDAARAWGVGIQQAWNLVKAHGIGKVKLGHRTVRLMGDEVDAVVQVRLGNKEQAGDPAITQTDDGDDE